MQYCNRFCAVSSLRPSIGCLRLTANHVRDVSPIFTVSVFQGVFWYLGHKTLSICYRGSLGRSFWDGEREQRAGHAGIRVAVSARFHREVRLKSRARGKTTHSFVIFTLRSGLQLETAGTHIHWSRFSACVRSNKMSRAFKGK